MPEATTKIASHRWPAATEARAPAMAADAATRLHRALFGIGSALLA